MTSFGANLANAVRAAEQSNLHIVRLRRGCALVGRQDETHSYFNIYLAGKLQVELKLLHGVAPRWVPYVEDFLKPLTDPLFGLSRKDRRKVEKLIKREKRGKSNRSELQEETQKTA